MITPGLVVGVVLLLGAPAALLAQQGVEDNIGAPANRVLELDGSGAHVELPSAPFADLSEATVEAWVRHDSWAYFSQWFAYATDTLWRSVGANHFSGTSTLQYFVYPGGSADLRAISVETALPLGRWYHMALVSGSQGMRFYLDGGLMGSNSHTGSFAGLEPATGVFLGHSPWKANQPFHGGLDEIRLWSVARSAEEIRADMGRPLRGDEPGLEGLWNFDAGDARDGTVRGGDGTLRNGAVCAAAPYPGLEPRLPPALVRGVIWDETGEPVGSARVRLEREGRTIDATSKPSGGFEVAVLDTGLYTLKVLNSTVRMPHREVHVAPGANVVLHLEPPPANLVASWPGEGDASDAVGEHHGEVNGDVTFAPGVVGQAFHFDGDTDNFVRVPNASDLNSQGSFSLSTWIFPESEEIMTILGMWGDFPGWLNQRAYLLAIEGGATACLQPGRWRPSGGFRLPHAADAPECRTSARLDSGRGRLGCGFG